MINYEVFNLLLKAKSKEVVLKICNESRNSTHSEAALGIVTSTLACTAGETATLLSSINNITSILIRKNIADAEDVSATFPSDFHKPLASLLTKIFVEMLPVWRDAEEGVSPPRLAGFSWSVSTEQGTDTPRCFLNLDVSKREGMERVNAHLSSEGLDTLLAGLKQIKTQIDQLSG